MRRNSPQLLRVQALCDCLCCHLYTCASCSRKLLAALQQLLSKNSRLMRTLLVTPLD
jgi:hypothetical protein